MPNAAADGLVDRLASWKSLYGTGNPTQLERLLERAANTRFREPATLVRLHETVLFLRAYPQTARVARLAAGILDSMESRVAALRSAGRDLAALEEPEISGIAGTAFSAVFSYEVVRRLAVRYPDLEIDWEAYDRPDRLGPVARRFLPLLNEDWPVEAHAPFDRWLDAARGRRTRLRYLLEQIAALPLGERERAELFESLDLPIRMDFSGTARTRSQLGLPNRPLYIHKRPLIARREVSLAATLNGPPLAIRPAPPRESRRVLDLILDTSAMRYRELYGFSHPQEDRVFHTDAGRGVEIYFFGVPPAWRLPLRAYHGGMFFKNGVPAGYVEVLSFFDRAEVGFNLYYTFREGESAWLYAQLLRLFHQTLGVTTFSVDPYQIGHENEEAIESGAFWFYRKLGFRPADPRIARLTEIEERRLAANPGERSTPRTLRKLAAGYVLFEGPGAQSGAWDRFQIRDLGLALTRKGLTGMEEMARLGGRWTADEKAALQAIIKAKYAGDESRYLRLMQRHQRLRALCIKLGARPAGIAAETHQSASETGR